MAVFFNGMSRDEAVALTLAMRDSGDVLDWSDLPGPVTDKHSTGGVGDNVSLMLAPIVAACGAYVPMISGRGLGHTGGTLDKMDSIPGYVSQPDNALFRKAVLEAGCAIIGQTADLAPADKRLYAIRDVTATVESMPLITASILSKKLAAGLQSLVLDVKVGNGAFMAEARDATALANSLVEVANGAGLQTSALITDMNEPLASAAGNAVEVRNAVDFLTGRMRDRRLEEVTLALAAEMLQSAGTACRPTRTACGAPREALASGRAAAHLRPHGGRARRPRRFRREAARPTCPRRQRNSRSRRRGRLRHRHRHPRHRPCRGRRSAAAARGRTTGSTTRSASPGCCRSARRCGPASRWRWSMPAHDPDAEAAAAAVLSAYAIGDSKPPARQGGHPADSAALIGLSALLHQQQRAVLDLVLAEPVEEAHADQVGRTAPCRRAPWPARRRR